MTRLGTATKLRLQLTPSLARTREFAKSRGQLNRLAVAVQPRPPRAARRPRSASRSRPQIEYPAGAENSFGLMGSPDRRRKGVRPGGVPAGAPPKVRPARRSMRISFSPGSIPHAYPASLRVLAYVIQHFLNDPVEGALHLGGDSSIEAGREQHLNLRYEGVRRASASIAGVKLNPELVEGGWAKSVDGRPHILQRVVDQLVCCRQLLLGTGHVWSRR